ncbi:HpcH/HpaI aldolase family protein [Microbacterium suwonense]|uniref:2,4-dihydroxyhept-2-ene-1,7-dioic acid aldolase n=1 Tax=Microbacterium suwonense TaxID=683047 RepID=A0ABN6X2L9_9MICO|nr:HpcH/HpaI aldolase/citrate lyase family protein [Microbacterium suwonense]BDZ39040.1 2,4-dihydroxyhept-2-ene-1,7-dioic acid aldolase [Microbacterium suwonense]
MPLRLAKPFRARLAESDRPLIGMWVCSGSPTICEIAAGSGVDWLLIDMEHSANSLESVLSQLQVAAAYPVTPVVRVPWNDAVAIKQVLDLGAQNIIVPMVSSADEARAAVAATRYPPQGVRGVGSALSRSARWNRIDGYLENATSLVSLTVQIETIAGVAAAAEIAAVDGVDAVFVGPSDLSASMGLLGQQTHPDVVAAVHSVFDAAHAAGSHVGVNAFAPDAADAYVEVGADFVAVGADVAMLARASEALASRFIPSASDEQRASY